MAVITILIIILLGHTDHLLAHRESQVGLVVDGEHGHLLLLHHAITLNAAQLVTAATAKRPYLHKFPYFIVAGYFWAHN